MRLVALTGGIGSGKSSVAEQLAERGATIVDSDLMVRELQEPGQPVFLAMVERWGDRIVSADGSLDRPAVAGIVFGDKAELDAINGIVHPAVKHETRARVDAAAKNGAEVVVLDIPLLAETGNRHGASAVIVVDCPTDIAVGRLMEHRGFSREDAEARVASQATREERRELADLVVDNSGELSALMSEVERCWEWLMTLEHTT
ncbi:MAG: dephospho-CoA kinase [Acidimicrobiales bacterium]|jgi:dephospho-CoA kinase